MKKIVIIERSFEKPWDNLAYEECLMDYAQKNKGLYILYLWQNYNAVIIGRNQNPWKELDFDVIRRESIDLARRITGGGAVYHDLGNLNFTFILPKDDYEEKRTMQIVVDALNKLGVPAEATGRNDICCGGRKISGSAFCTREEIGLHHGTLLLNVNLDRMSKCLTPDKAKLNSKGIDSVYSRVMNLQSEYKHITLENVKEAIKTVFLENFNNQDVEIENHCDIDEKLFSSLITEYSSYKWLYGEIMENCEEISSKFDWGMVSIKMQFEESKIVKCVIETDSLETNIFTSLALKIEGCNLDKKELLDIINNGYKEFTTHQKKMADDIIHLIISRIRE